jgi:hypothetical protein
MTYDGIVVGGPLDGQRLVATSTITLFPEPEDPMDRHEPFRPRETVEYRAFRVGINPEGIGPVDLGFIWAPSDQRDDAVWKLNFVGWLAQQGIGWA